MNIDSLLYELAAKDKQDKIYKPLYFKTPGSDYNNVVDFKELHNMQYEFIALVDFSSYSEKIYLLKIADFCSENILKSKISHYFDSNVIMFFCTFYFKNKIFYIVDAEEFNKNKHKLINMTRCKQIEEADLTDVDVMK